MQLQKLQARNILIKPYSCAGRYRATSGLKVGVIGFSPLVHVHAYNVGALGEVNPGKWLPRSLETKTTVQFLLERGD